MTHPPHGSDQPGRTPEQSDPDRHPTEPVPFFGTPGGPPGGYGQPPGQAYGPQGPDPRYGQPGQGQPPYGPPPSGPPGYGPPAYGASPYGAAPGPWGPPAPPAKSRVGLIAAVTAGIVALIAVGVVLALTMSSTVLDRTAVQQDVGAQFEQREGVAVDLQCAEEMKVASGATYECTGTTADGEDVTLQIAITDEESAAYTWTEP